MDFLGFSIRAPLAVIAASFYVLGAFTGGSAYALLRRSVQAASATTPTAPELPDPFFLERSQSRTQYDDRCQRD